MYNEVYYLFGLPSKRQRNLFVVFKGTAPGHHKMSEYVYAKIVYFTRKDVENTCAKTLDNQKGASVNFLAISVFQPKCVCAFCLSVNT